MEKGYPHSVMVRMQIGIGVLWNNLGKTPKVENAHSIQSINCPSSYLP